MYIVQASPTVSILFHVSRLTIGITVAANKAQSQAGDGAETSRQVDPTYLEQRLDNYTYREVHPPEGN